MGKVSSLTKKRENLFLGITILELSKDVGFIYFLTMKNMRAILKIGSNTAMAIGGRITPRLTLRSIEEDGLMGKNMGRENCISKEKNISILGNSKTTESTEKELPRSMVR